MRELTLDEMAEIRGGDLEGFLCSMAFGGFCLSQAAWLSVAGIATGPTLIVGGSIMLIGAAVCNFLNS